MSQGKAIVFQDNIDTDQIIGAQYLTLPTITHMVEHTFEHHSCFTEDYSRGDFIVAADNFGCGSSREQAAAVLKELGVGGIIAKSFARIFFRNAINLGIPLFECSRADSINHLDLLEVSDTGIRNLVSGETYTITPLPPFMKTFIKSGGMIPYLQQQKGRG